MAEPTKYDDFAAWMRLTFGPEWRTETYKHRDMLECWQAARQLAPGKESE